MRDRKKQREARKVKNVATKPWLNHEGYRDPTAYAAMRNVERERKRQVKA